MDIKDWAKREIEIAKNEADGYGSACLNSAYKAFESLLSDEHSGMSISITKQILNRLIDGKTLTPIEDTEDIWNFSHNGDNGSKHYQCKRMSSLFKDVDSEGNILYSDINRYVMLEITTNTTWHSGLCDYIGEELFPIKMPYSAPNKSFIIRCEEILFDPKNGDYDTVRVLDITNTEGEVTNIYRYFREPNNNETPDYHGWKEINASEWNYRFENRYKKEGEFNEVS